MIAGRDIVLLAHAGCGMLGILAALWVCVEALNTREGNASRIRFGSLLTTASVCVAWILGGYWYLHFYPAEKAIILKGPWPFAHNVFMETKEHLFFATLILAIYLPICAAERLDRNAIARRMVVSVALLIVATGLAVEAAGAVIDHGVKIALLRLHS
ncbi:MAG TPA: hypothetical protein VKS01_03430 [Bryobacteraceae bacterium]|nr:hypothetical protein [Bryobacteraceae bacterium]